MLQASSELLSIRCSRLDETQPWYIICIDPNDLQLPNQLEGRSVKEQVKCTGLVEIAKRCTNMFEVNMTPEEFCEQYSEGLEGGGISEGDPRERVDQAGITFGLGDQDLVLGRHKVRFRSFD